MTSRPVRVRLPFLSSLAFGAALFLLLLSGKASSHQLKDTDLAAVHTIGEYVASAPSGATDRLLADSGFDSAQIAVVPGWSGFSPHRKLQLALESSQSVSVDNGERFMALLVHNLSRTYPSADTVVSSDIRAKLSPQPILFTDVAAHGSGVATTNPETQAFIRNILDFVETGGPLSADRLMAEALVPDHIAYESLWSHADPGAALHAALSAMQDGERTQVMIRMADVVVRFYPAAAEEPAIKQVRSQKRDTPPNPPEARHGPQTSSASEGPRPFDRPTRPAGGPGAGPTNGGPHRRPWDIDSDDLGGAADGGDRPGGGPGSRGPKPGRSGGPGGSGALPSGNDVGSPDRLPGSPSLEPSSAPMIPGGADRNVRISPAAARFQRLMSRRGSTTFRSMTTGSMGLRLGGVVFGNDVSDLGGERPGSLLIGQIVEVQGRSGQHYVLKASDPAETCLAVAVAQSGNYGMAGITDQVEGKFNVQLNPKLVNSTIGRSMILIDSLPINVKQTLRLLPNATPADRDRLRALWQAMATPDFAGGWQVVDVPMRIGLADGQVQVQVEPLPTEVPLRQAFIELRPVTRVGPGDTGFNLAWARRFRFELPTLSMLYPAFGMANQFARTLAVVRWVKQHGGTLPVGCTAPPQEVTPDAVMVTDQGIKAVAAFDPSEEHCRILARTEPWTNERQRGCMDLFQCRAADEEARASDPHAESHLDDCTEQRARSRCRRALGTSGSAERLELCKLQGDLLILHMMTLEAKRWSGSDN